MDAVSSAVEKVKQFAISSQNSVNGLLHHLQNSYSRNPIEILKRLQREAFSDLMKLRDRQDKVERVLSFYKTSKGSPFHEASTHVRGEVDFLGAILMMRDIDSQHLNALDRAGVRTGITSRFIFETSLGQNDSLVAELIARATGNGYFGDISGIPLSLAKLFYAANVSDWCSATAIPVGAQCRDFNITRNSSQQRQGLTYISSFEPPLLSQHNGSAIGVTVRKSNVVASLAQSVSGLEMPVGSDGFGHCFNTFGQVVCQLPRGIKLSLMGLHQVPKVLDYRLSLGVLTIPVGFLQRHETLERTVEADAAAPCLRMNIPVMPSTRSIALKLESELDESTRVGGWIEMQNSNYKHLRWAVTVSDNFEDDIGWGVSLSGIKNPRGRDQYQFESFADLSLGKRFNLKPGVAYVVDGDAKILALMLRCNWSL
ncbi:uncharacterized protein LOC123212893 [Mangifera indica]|uniref:uncharacterized protein LOC123212893 n=1 Tax=Mangifera indica TaxID=29780 RepID=UPI001CF9FA76|nr:uncharacterized protein LOC123212893 [Mangifera indica]XP_044488057.1 uncharacterized protein LOC123212893 [Mangifera indica]